MSASSVITLGYGSGGTPSLIITLGFGGAALPFEVRLQKSAVTTGLVHKSFVTKQRKQLSGVAKQLLQDSSF